MRVFLGEKQDTNSFHLLLSFLKNVLRTLYGTLWNIMYIKNVYCICIRVSMVINNLPIKKILKL